jgi:hypothetical protein
MIADVPLRGVPQRRNRFKLRRGGHGPAIARPGQDVLNRV